MNSAADPTSAAGYRIVPLEEGTIAALADAHCACFPGYFLTTLGPAYVQVFYGALLKSSLGITVLALDQEGKVLGFAVGATNGMEFRRYLYRHHFLRTVWTVLKGLVTSRDVRRFVLSKRHRITQALRLVLSLGVRRNDPKPPQGHNDEALRRQWAEAVTLMSMGARPECRGRGIAEDTIRAFEAFARELGGKGVKLSTGKDNLRAIGFYEKSGYVLYSDARPKGVDYLKVL